MDNYSHPPSPCHLIIALSKGLTCRRSQLHSQKRLSEVVFWESKCDDDRAKLRRGHAGLARPPPSMRTDGRYTSAQEGRRGHGILGRKGSFTETLW